MPSASSKATPKMVMVMVTAKARHQNWFVRMVW